MAAAVAYVNVAQELYLSYFGRPADSTGLANMTAALAAADAPTTTAGLDAAYATNATVRTLLDSFGSSAESNALYTASSSAFVTAQFVTAIFNNLFGRAPAAGGLEFWTNAINSGSLTRAAAAHSILTGAVVANGADAALIAKKVTVANSFTTAIDTPAEVNAYRGGVAAQTARELLSSVSAATDTNAYLDNVTSTLAKLNGALVLGVGADNLPGTDTADLFTANIIDNGNTLQSGDRLSGGNGNDTLRANVAQVQSFAAVAETSAIENVVISAQTVAGAGGSTAGSQDVLLDAERMSGVLRWEDNNSRADLRIEDVRLQANQITRDVTVAMVSTDPGNVDFGAYFDQASLRAGPVATVGSTLRLQLMNTRSNDAGTGPLADSPYNGFQFTFNDKLVRVTSDAIDQAQTYAQLADAIQAAVAATPGIQHFVVSLGSTFRATDTLSGKAQIGQEILLTNPGTGMIGLGASTGWLTGGAVTGGSLHTVMLTAQVVTTAAKIASTIVLDDVGRGGIGGDLLVGGMSIGDTSTSNGVQRFDITVERNSKLQTINSTDNRLEEVTLINGLARGDLQVNGNANSAPGTGTDLPLPGSVTQYGGSQHGDGYGFHDVRLINGAAMAGKLDLTAVVTERAYAKYINQVDMQNGPATDSVNVAYTGGANNDKLIVDIDAGVISSRGRVLSNLEDFTFAVNGGAGDDLLQVRVVPSANAGSTWLAGQDRNNNLAINGGDGNDTIRKLGAGDAVINGGAGNDTVYAENTGAQRVMLQSIGDAPVNAHWVFNTTDQVGALGAARRIGSLQADTTDSYKLMGAKLGISFKGIASTVSTDNILLNAISTDLDLNQVLKHLINDDAALSKLLVATDGPSGTLIVRSLIDGVFVPADLKLTMLAPTVDSLSVFQVSAAAAAYGLTGPNATAANVVNIVNSLVGEFLLGGDYTSAMAVDDAGTSNLVGANSLAVSDNVITPGAGNDVVVLGTAIGASVGTSSNDTLVFGASAGGFGNDTIVNFNAASDGIDHLDFTALGGTTLSAALTTDKSITIAAASTANDTAAKVGAFFDADNTSVQTHVYAVVDATGNAATIYAITDAVGARNAVATAQGSIDLGTVNWLTGLGQANFVDSGVTNYHLFDGVAGYTAPAAVTTKAVALNMDTVAAAQGNAFIAGADNSIFTFTTTPDIVTDVTISGYAALDGLRFARGTTLTFTDLPGDGLIDILVNDGANSVTVHLTGLNGDGGISTLAGFNAVYGAGSIIIG